VLASGDDGVVRARDPAAREALFTIDTSYRVTAVHEIATLLAIAHDFGVLVIELNLGT
jgi:hypothetical protein